MTRFQRFLMGGVLAGTSATALAGTTTGSHIEREPGEACGAQNVKVITRDDIERSGALTLADAIRRSPRRADTALPECQDKPQNGQANPGEASTG